MRAQRIDVAIVFRDMLGAEDAARYMAQYDVPDGVAKRVLAGMEVTRMGDGMVVEYQPATPRMP